MGMYTRLELDVLLGRNTPYSVIEILHIMCRKDGANEKQAEIDSILVFNANLAHEVFNTWRASWMFRCDGGLDETEIPYFVRSKDNVYRLKLAFSVKNHERCINLFLDWLSPFVSCSPDGVRLGTYQYEEDAEESWVVWIGGELAIVAPREHNHRDYDAFGRPL